MRIKSPPCCQLHHDPVSGCGVCVSIDIDVASALRASFVSHFKLHSSHFLSGSPANRTQRDPVIGRIQATSLRLPIQSGASESNRDPPAPKAGVLPSAPVPELYRRQGRRTSFQLRRGKRQWAGRCSNPRLRLFRPLLDRLSYQPVAPPAQQKTRHPATPGWRRDFPAASRRHK